MDHLVLEDVLMVMLVGRYRLDMLSPAARLPLKAAAGCLDYITEMAATGNCQKATAVMQLQLSNDLLSRLRDRRQTIRREERIKGLEGN
jgi:hypothetical protein